MWYAWFRDSPAERRGISADELKEIFTTDPLTTVLLLSLVYGGITFQQSTVFGVCLDVGCRNAGAVVGLMNTSAQVGGLVASVAYGYIVSRFGSYDAPFVPMAALLFLGALLWLKVDAATEVSADNVSTGPLRGRGGGDRSRT